jgi:crotonobetainyl-CoA:carnitine CoA-transferase CaiB-like acyl-CoA transferase
LLESTGGAWAARPEHRVPDRTRAALESILSALQWQDPPLDRLEVTPHENVLPTSLPVGPCAAAALSATGLAAAAIHARRGNAPPRVRVDLRRAALATANADYLRVDGKAVKSWDSITGYYRASDAWVYLHGNFPHLRDGLLHLLGASNDRDAVAAAVARWCADDIEREAGSRGLCAVRVRRRDEWRAHPQFEAAAAAPLVRIRRIGGAPREPSTSADRPLSGVRMLDLSRVIAGPMVGRTLAEHGATVMLVSGPHLPSLEPLVIDTGFGKLSAALDLRAPVDAQRLHDLAADADVFLDAYRPGSLDARGYTLEALARRRPGIVYVSISAFCQDGPWAQRRGYDTLVCAASGFGYADSDMPRRLPCQPLDYLTGYLGACGAMVALQRRALEGGSWHVSLSLDRTAAWLWEMTDLLGREARVAAAKPAMHDVEDLCAVTRSAFGELKHFTPMLDMPGAQPRWARAPVPLGSDPAAWP